MSIATAPDFAITPPVAVGRARADEPATIGELVVRAQRGDAEAFDLLVAARLARTVRLARAILTTVEDAEDATQDAFISAWRRLRSLRDPERFDAWFARIALNACRMTFRRRSGPTVVSSDELLGDRYGVDDHALTRLTEADALQRAIERLTVAQRGLLALRHLEGRPINEIASILRIPEGTVKWRLHRARAALVAAVEAES